MATQNKNKIKFISQVKNQDFTRNNRITHDPF